ncbi:MAG: ATP-binding protein [Bacteroidales bacterium]|nr:ATP-binding protein [Bacteroidales bacterium]
MNEENLHNELSLDDLFSNINRESKKEKKAIVPFKFLDSYTLEDKDIFYGRDDEINEIYRKFHLSNILLIYGKSGTGKSSVVNCGLRSKIPTSDLYPITIRCGKEAYKNFNAELIKHSSVRAPDSLSYLKHIYETKFKPIALIFDQFEEVFILSTSDERKALLNEIKIISESTLSVSFIFIIREEYYANLTEFEDEIPSIYSNRIRIEKMDKNHVEDAIYEPCKICNVAVEKGLSDKIINQLTKNTGQLELTWFQVLMDKLYKIAIERDKQNPELKIADLDKLGRIDKVLTTFVDDQLQKMENGINGEFVLKTLVSVDGTKKQLKIDEIHSGLNDIGIKISFDEVKDIVKYFTDVRILSEKDENGYYEFRHDSIAARIFERMTAFEKELSEVRKFIENSLKIFDNRQKLLDQNDLNYIAPYLEKLILTKEQKELINKSKKQIQKNKNRKLRLVGFIIIFILAVSSGLTIWALISKAEAENQKQIADEQRIKADSLYEDSMLSNYQKFITIGDSELDKGEFDKAEENYEIARTFIDSSEIDLRLLKIDTIRKLSSSVDSIIAEAEKLYASGQYYNAKIKYQEALNNDYKTAIIENRIDEIQGVIDSKVNSLLHAIQDFLDQGYQDMALKRISQVLELDPDNVKAKDYLKMINQ